MICGIICQPRKCNFHREKNVSLKSNISFRLHGYIFCTAENSLIGHNLTRDVWRVKFKDCSRTHFCKSHWNLALKVVASCKLQRSIDRWKGKRRDYASFAEANPKGCIKPFDYERNWKWWLLNSREQAPISSRLNAVDLYLVVCIFFVFSKPWFRMREWHWY